MKKTDDRGVRMKDGRMAWLTESKRYYARREPNYEKFTGIRYYDLKRNRIQLAKGTCPGCGDTIESRMCGDFRRCKCGKSFVDTDRWFPERHRYGGLLAHTTDNGTR